MSDDFDDKEFRDAFVDEFIRNGIAFQIRALRHRENWSQKELGDKTGKPQNVISRLEDPSYGSFTIKTLLEMASAFDVALQVRFVPFSELEKSSRRLTPADLAVARFSDEKSASTAEHGGTLAHETRLVGANTEMPTVQSDTADVNALVIAARSEDRLPIYVNYSGVC